MEIKPDVIIIGAGPAGISTALTVRRAGFSVVVLDRGKFSGSKNMFGGAVYLQSIKDLLPNSYKEAPYERTTVSHSFEFLTNSGAKTSFLHTNPSHKTSATIFRPKFDSWLVDEAKKEGVYFAPSTVVREILKENGNVVGIKTEQETLKAFITVIAEGANSLLAEQIGLKKKDSPKDIILGVKETFKLDCETINRRFNLKDEEGIISEFFGGLPYDVLGMGFLYTFKNHISLGLGISLFDLADKKLKPYEIFDKFKLHPEIEKIIKDAKSVEYSAHLIPDGGYNKMPKLYDNGVLIVGDAGGFIDPVHFEGTNLAIYSGIMAGETIVEALKKQDFSKKALKIYKQKFNKSFVADDLKSYKNAIAALYKRKNSIFEFYPNVMDDFFSKFTSSNSVPKKKLYRSFIKNLLFSRNIKEMFKDCIEFAKIIIEVLK